MTKLVTPKLEGRTAREIYDVLAERETLPAESSDELREALLRIFARYFEITAQRLNRVPDKNYFAFLNALGVSRIPPTPAQVPLTFVPVKNPGDNPVSINVLVSSKVAAPPGPGESEPVVFETLRSLTLTHAELCKVISFDPRHDRYSDQSELALPEPCASQPVFAGKLPVEHSFYIGHAPIFGLKGISQLRVRFEVAHPRSASSAGTMLEWGIATPKGPVFLKPAEDTTKELTRSGEVVFNNLPDWPEHEILGQKNRWLSCRLLAPIKIISHKQHHASGPLSRLTKIGIVASWKEEQATIKSAFFNNLQLDTSKDFFPFGERPRFGDVFYLNCDAFCLKGATVSVKITLTNPA
ncbi:MAG: hypothetical protein ABFS02_05625 [Pseudomonadota bacterium]